MPWYLTPKSDILGLLSCYWKFLIRTPEFYTNLLFFSYPNFQVAAIHCAGNTTSLLMSNGQHLEFGELGAI